MPKIKILGYKNRIWTGNFKDQLGRLFYTIGAWLGALYHIDTLLMYHFKWNSVTAYMKCYDIQEVLMSIYLTIMNELQTLHTQRGHKTTLQRIKYHTIRPKCIYQNHACLYQLLYYIETLIWSIKIHIFLISCKPKKK